MCHCSFSVVIRISRVVILTSFSSQDHDDADMVMKTTMTMML
jgi:hypothetical protein